MDKRVIGISYANKDNFNSNLNLNLKLYLPKDKNTKIICLGKDWKWMKTSPDGYLISKGPFSTRKLVCYYIPRHPVEWALEGEREEREERGGYSYGLSAIMRRSIDTSSSDFYSGHSGSMSNLSKYPVVSTYQRDREIEREKEYGNEKENERNNRDESDKRNRENSMEVSEEGEREYIKDNNNNSNNNDDEHFLHVEMDADALREGQGDRHEDMYTHSMDNLEDSESVLTLPIHGNKIREIENHHFSSQLSVAQHVLDGDCTDSALIDDDVLVSSILKNSNADLNCPNIISFVLEYLLGMKLLSRVIFFLIFLFLLTLLLFLVQQYCLYFHFIFLFNIRIALSLSVICLYVISFYYLLLFIFINHDVSSFHFISCTFTLFYF